ncbi:MAG TPA: hypothetical protein VH062_08630 [Polyangiaceae bacterium]|jgi:hypothetical protein|nr:hypothetical protein [Polyangiaceae bacterium]
MERFQFEAVRDLLGILRALYAADRSRGANARRLGHIRSVAVELRHAMELALEHDAGTAGHRAAVRRAEHATRRLADLVDVTTPLEPMLLAAGQRVRVASAPQAGARDLKRRARNERS